MGVGYDPQLESHTNSQSKMGVVYDPRRKSIEALVGVDAGWDLSPPPLFLLENADITSAPFNDRRSQQVRACHRLSLMSWSQVFGINYTDSWLC